MPAKRPANIDFKATTLGSATSCDFVTSLCDMNSTAGGYDCRREKAGLTLSGNFSDLPDSIFDYKYTDFLKSSGDAFTPTGQPGEGPKFWYAVVLRIPSFALSKKVLFESIESSESGGYAIHTCGGGNDVMMCGILSCSTMLFDVVSPDQIGLGPS